MKSQTTYTKAMTLGPFLTLILLSSPKRTKATNDALQSVSGAVPTFAYTTLTKREEVFNEAKPTPTSPLTLGPILTLILTVGRSQSQAGGG
jgi:hypothetical protein